MICGGEYLTDLIISFALINKEDGHSIYIPELKPLENGKPAFDIWNETAALKKRYPHLKINISVGGWGADGFSDMADDPKLRAAFSANVCDWLLKYNLDGVDIDWEYPVGPEGGQEIKSRPEDNRNYILLLQDLRDAVDALGAKTGKYYSLSTAVPAVGWFTTANYVASAAKITDALKLMAYDYYGAWKDATGHNSNLFCNPDDPSCWSTDRALEAYFNAGAPPEKIMLGAAFYGRAFQGVEGGPNGDGLFQPYKSISFGGGVDRAQINEFLKTGSGYTRYWDDYAKAPYLYNGNMWITYTDPEHIKLLAEYAKEKKLKGVFNWEYAHDMDAELLKVLSGN
jgi:chitinase